MHDLIGTWLGKYQIIAPLGAGGMAWVYKAHHPALDRLVAIKVMQPDVATWPGFADSVGREALAVARLRHPNIVHVFDFDVADEMPYMVMEFVAGPTLKAELQRRAAHQQAYTVPEIIALCASLANALDYAHSHGIVHRDLKPDNMMFTAEGQIVLTDFGIAQMASAVHVTTSGIILGTPAYMSPEQTRGHPVDHRSDLYSLGILLYELLTGSKPFSGDTPGVIIRQQRDVPIPRPTSINPALSPAIEQVVLTATSKHPDDRYQSATALVRALRAAAGQTEPLAEQPDIPLAPYPDEIPVAPRSTILLELPACPYRGLMAFREADAPFFFGRDAAVDQVLVAIEQQSTVALIGPSGSGKSSVVLAGLLPHLRQGEHFRQAQGTAWLISTMRPGAHPFRALAAAWQSLLHPDDALLAELERGECRISELARQIVQQQPHAHRVLLVIDQFEELYTLTADASLRQRFLDDLLAAVTPAVPTVPAAPAANDTPTLPGVPPPALTVVLTLRADFVGHALSYRPLADLLQTHTLILGPMNRQELYQAVVSPAQKLGVPFERGLVERILNDVGSEPGNLPLLEFALTLLWEQHDEGQLTHRAYEAIGRVAGALASYADTVYAALSPAEQAQARRVLVQLVQPGEGTEDTRRLASITEFSPADWLVAQKLAAARLVVMGRDVAGQETVEVVHEALIRSWGRLQDWMRTDRAFRAWQERLRRAIHEWEATSQDEGALLRGAPLAESEAWLAERAPQMTPAEQQFIQTSIAVREREQQARDRLRRRILAGTLTAAAVLAVLLVVAGALWRHAEQQTVEAQQQTRLVTARQLAAEAQLSLSADPARGMLLALEAIASTAEPDGFSLASAEAALRQALSTSEQIAAPHVLPAQREPVLALAFSPAGDWLATASGDLVHLWDVTTPLTQPVVLSGHGERITDMTVSPDGRWLVATSLSTAVWVWDTQQPQRAPVQPGGQATAGQAVTVSRDGRWLATADREHGLRLWATDDLTGTARLVPVVPGTSTMALSPDGGWLAVAGDDRTHQQHPVVQVWATDALTATPMLLRGHDEHVTHLRFSSDGHWLAAVGAETLWLWQVRNPTASPIEHEHAGQVTTLAFSPDGRWFATGSDDTTARLWTMANLNAAPSILRGHTAQVTGLAFSPDGQRLVTSGGGTLLLWDMRRLERSLLEPVEMPGQVARFSPDGRWLATADQGTVQVWHAGLEDIMALACATTGRNLTWEEWQQFIGEAPYRRTCAQHPTHPSVAVARVQQAASHIQAGRQAEAAALLAQVATFDREARQQAAAELVALGQARAHASDIAGAVALFQHANGLVSGIIANPAAAARAIAAEELLTQGRDRARAIDVDGAVARFEQARELSPTLTLDPEAEARQLAVATLLVQGEEHARASDIDGAVARFAQARDLSPTLAIDPQAEAQQIAAAALVQQATTQVRQGQIADALAAVERAQALAPDRAIAATAWNDLCWYGSVWGQAAEVLDACDDAIQQAPENANFYDSRGLARALTGNRAGAIDDFQVFIAWLEEHNPDAAALPQRQTWLADLQAGRDPFDAETLHILREE